MAPRVAINGSGDAIAVWSASDNIWANRFDGTSWGSAVLLEKDAGSASSPQIALDSSGNAIAVWSQYDDDYSNIWANRFNGINW